MSSLYNDFLVSWALYILPELQTRADEISATIKWSNLALTSNLIGS